jgi:2-iminoacetate synthase
LENPSSAKFKNTDYINHLLAQGAKADSGTVSRILDKAAGFAGLTPEETAVLLTADVDDRLYTLAKRVKRHIYGDRIVLFAPLYVSDHCVNDCAYCGFGTRHEYPRRRLTPDEIAAEAQILSGMGHKRVALEAGEHPLHAPLDYILDAIHILYQNGIRRVNVNIAPPDVEGFARLKTAGIGTYILFQETYHRPTYEQVHRAGRKADYEWHTHAMERALQAGIDDVGGGVLFGLYDWKYDALALMCHNQYLEEAYGVGFHTLSLPRIRRAKGAAQAQWPNAVNDADFLRLTAVLRLAVPYTGMIISTRETPDMRKKLVECGVSQLSGGSSARVGGYAAKDGEAVSQFDTADERTPHQIIEWLVEEGLIPSFCTACYRTERVGGRFMSMAKQGDIKRLCLPNALITLAEYAQGYGGDDFRQKAQRLLDAQLPTIENDEIRQHTQACIRRIQQGERDIYV